MATETNQTSNKQSTVRPAISLDDILALYKEDMPVLPDLPLDTGELATASEDDGDAVLGFIGIVGIICLILMAFSYGSYKWSEWGMNSAKEEQVEVQTEHDSLVNQISQLNEKKAAHDKRMKQLSELQQQIATLEDQIQQQIATLKAQIQEKKSRPTPQPAPQPKLAEPTAMAPDASAAVLGHAKAYLEAKTKGKTTVFSTMMGDNLSYNLDGNTGTSRQKFQKELQKEWKKQRNRSYKLLAFGTRKGSAELIYSYSYTVRKNKSRSGFVREHWTINDEGRVTEIRVTTSDNEPAPNKDYTYTNL